MILETAYKDQKAVAVENDLLRFVFLPETGASLASVFWKRENRELLVQRPEPRYRRVPFGGSYVDAECSGMDDMFPTIDACHYENAPWEGVKLTDHGEIWNLPFQTRLLPDSVSFSASGVRLPYAFSKRAEFVDAHTLRITYRAENPAPFDMDFLWAAHFMLRAQPGVSLMLPGNCRAAQAVFTNSGSIGAYAQEFPYPVFTDAGGKRRDISRMGEWDGSCEKFYLRDRLQEGYCGVAYPDGLRFELSFPEDKVPYLGVLFNQGGFREIYNLFVEPCTAPFDRPDVARLMDKHSLIPARSSYDWHLDIRVSDREDKEVTALEP